jgi:hypothetical protein
MRREQRCPVLVAAAAFCCAPLAALASPFEAPDVDPEENIELKTTLERRSSGEAREWDAPQIELTFPVRSRVEASIEAGYAIEESGDERQRHGLGDLELNAKWQFLRTERTRLTLEPAITFDIADDLGEDDHAIELGLIGARTFRTFELDGRIGYERSFDGEDDAYFGSALLLFDVSEDIRIGAELAATHADALHLRANFGIKWEAAEHIELQVLIGRTLEYDDGPPVTRAKLVLEHEFE